MKNPAGRPLRYPTEQVVGVLMVRAPYHPLSEVTVVVAKALLTASGWSWPSRSMAVYQDGRQEEIRGAPPLGDAVPHLLDPGTVGGLLGQLAEVCGDRVSWEIGCNLQSSPLFWLRLRARDHQREWHGQSLGEVVGLALIARRARARR